MAKTDLQKFRRDISVLKRQGLIGGADFDPRTAQPKMLRGGKFLSEYVAKYDDVISGKATAVKLPPSQLKAHKKLGDEIVRAGGIEPRVLIPHAANEKVTVRRGRVIVKHPKGVDRAIIPEDPTILFAKNKDLKSYLQTLANTKVPKGGKRYFAFNFYGNQSLRIYQSLDDLIEELSAYNAVEYATNKGDAKSMMDVFRHIEIVTVNSLASWKAAKPPKNVKQRSDASNKRRNRRRRDSFDRAPEWKQDQERADSARRMREYRARMSSSEKKEYNKDSKKRAKKSHKKLRGKKK